MGRGNIASASKDELVLVALKGVCSGYVYKPVTAVSPPCNQERLWPQRAWVTVYVIQVKRPCPTIIQGGDSFAGAVVLGGCFWLRPWRSAAKGVEIAIAERQGSFLSGPPGFEGPGGFREEIQQPTHTIEEMAQGDPEVLDYEGTTAILSRGQPRRSCH